MKFTYYLSIAMLAMSVAFTSCKPDDGKDGDPGPVGQNGTNGTNGTNGEGFDEATKYGNVLVYLDGTRPDGVAFKDTLNFKFMPTSMGNTYSEIYDLGDNYDVYSYVRRFLAMDNASHESDSYASIEFEPWINTEIGDTVKYFYFNLNADVVTSDFKYFRLNDDYYDYGGGNGGNIADSTFNAYNYNSATGSLKYKFAFTSLAGNNGTGYDLKVSGVVNAIVFQNIGGDACGDCGRTSRTARISENKNSRKAVVKAEMKSLK